MAHDFYRAYLLRLWRDHGQTPLRVTLISTAQPDQHYHFENLEACMAFLHGQIGAVGRNDLDTTMEQNSDIVPQTTTVRK